MSAERNQHRTRGGLHETTYLDARGGARLRRGARRRPGGATRRTRQPKLEVRQAGTSAIVKASLDPNDDPTASVRIFVPTGTQLTTTQAPGTTLGPVRAIVKALDLAGRRPAARGQPGRRGTRADRTRDPGCLPRGRHAARDLGDGVERGGPDPARPRVPRRDDGSAGSARPRVHPGVPAAARRSGGNARSGDVRGEALQRRAHHQRRLQRVSGRVGRVLDAVHPARRSGQRCRNGRVSCRDRAPERSRSPRGRSATSREGRRSRALPAASRKAASARCGGATVTIFGGAEANRPEAARHAYARRRTARSRSGRRPASSSARPSSPRPAPHRHRARRSAPAIAPVPCVNPTINGFTAQSRVIRKR